MRIKEIRVKNYRSILDEILECDPLTALVGRNGAGKSAFLSALELFYDASPNLTDEDYYNTNVDDDIEIEIAYHELNVDAQEEFAKYVEDGVLRIVRVFKFSDGKKSGTFHGMRLQNPDFTRIRNIASKRDLTGKYRELRALPKYPCLPNVNSADDSLSEMDKWEAENPDELERSRDEGQFFGWGNVGQGRLNRYTELIRVPAVRDASEDATEGRGSSVTRIMDRVVRNALESKDDFVSFRQEAAQRIKDITDPTKVPEFNNLERQLTETLNSYVADVDVLLDWGVSEDFRIPLPQARVRLIEDGFGSLVDRTGHGLQRAFILTMLQHLAAAERVADPEDESHSQSDDRSSTNHHSLPSLVLAIEEPELYQHPSQQRHFARVLMDLATGAIPGVASDTQVIYTTHSPLFVGLERFDQIRVVAKVESEPGYPKTSKISRTDLDSVATQLWQATGSNGTPFTATSLRSRLHSIMTPWMNEGFFADVAVLVEGEDDRAAILGTALSMNIDFDAKGIAVIPCGGKDNLDRPLLIFKNLDILAYVIWDGDCGKRDSKPEANKRLMVLNARAPEDQPQGVWDAAACFRVDLETTIKEDIGSVNFETFFSEAMNEFDFNGSTDARKNPHVFKRFLEIAASNGSKSETLEKIVLNIQALREGQVPSEPFFASVVSASL